MSGDKDQSAGRKANDAMPLGHREGGDTDRKVGAVGEREKGSAGPDGPSATAVGDTFRRR